MIGTILPVIGRPPIELSAYLCRFWLLWEDDRRDRPVRGLSSLFTMAPPFPYRRKDRTGIALSAVEDRHRYHRYHRFWGCPLVVGSYTRVLVLSLCVAREKEGVWADTGDSGDRGDGKNQPKLGSANESLERMRPSYTSGSITQKGSQRALLHTPPRRFRFTRHDLAVRSRGVVV